MSHPGPDTQREDNAFNLFLVKIFFVLWNYRTYWIEKIYLQQYMACNASQFSTGVWENVKKIHLTDWYGYGYLYVQYHSRLFYSLFEPSR